MGRIRVKYTANGKFKLKISFSNQKTCRLKQSKKICYGQNQKKKTVRGSCIWFAHALVKDDRVY